jgi:hypothetical protein
MGAGERVQTGDGFILVGFVVLVVAAIGPRRVWKAYGPMKYRNPEYHERTDTYFFIQRCLWIAAGLAVLLFGCQARDEAAKELSQRPAPAVEWLTDGEGAGGLRG